MWETQSCEKLTCEKFIQHFFDFSEHNKRLFLNLNVSINRGANMTLTVKNFFANEAHGFSERSQKVQKFGNFQPK